MEKRGGQPEPKRVVIHEDVLDEDMEAIRRTGGEVSAYQKAKDYITKTGGDRIPYEVSPEELAKRYKAGDTIILTGCYGDNEACIDQYRRALEAKGVRVIRDNEGIVG